VSVPKADIWLTVLLAAALVTVQLRRRQKRATRDRVATPPAAQTSDSTPLAASPEPGGQST
jgi:hypothetical protein